MLLKKRRDGKYFALITPAIDMTPATAMPTYTQRWRIENFFAENAFLGVNHLPSLNLNAIQTMLSLRLLAFHVMDNFRYDLGPAYQHQTPELIHREVEVLFLGHQRGCEADDVVVRLLAKNALLLKSLAEPSGGDRGERDDWLLRP